MSTSTATAADYIETTERINGVQVTVYGGAKRPIRTYSLPGHVTGWSKRNGARTTYAELTCTCGLVGELWSQGGPSGKGWTSYGEDGWIDYLNGLALAHVENVTANGFEFRPAGGDKTRHADRTRVDLETVSRMIEATGNDVDQVIGQIVRTGFHFTAEDGTRFELARDRSRWSTERLPIS